MASYNITSPDGQKYKINAPDGASEAEVLAYAQKNFKMAKVSPMEESSLASRIGQHGGNLLAGAVRGAGSIGSTLISPFESSSANKQRRQAMDDALQSFGAEPDSNMYGFGKIGAEIAGTAGAGGALARGAMLLPGAARVAPLLSSIGSGGMSVNGMKGAAAVGTRALGGAVSGGLQAGLVNQNDAGTGAMIGAALPGAFQLAGKAGQSIYKGAKNMVPNSGQMLADVLGVSADDLPRIIAAAKQAPDEIIPGSKLTLNQALQLQGAADPNIKLLERIVSGGPGGNTLLKRYAEQSAARTALLEANGAQTYQGAAAEEAMKAGNKIGAILRTQAVDDMASQRALWERLYKRGADEGVALQLPIDGMNAAMSPLGRGSVVSGSNARRVLSTADDIGHLVIPAVDDLAKETANNSQTLEKAVRAAGGIKGGSGELRDLGIKQSGTTGLVNNKTGQSADLLAAEMYRRGFIPDADPATLFDALRNGGGRKLFANDQIESNAMQRMSEAAMGDPPGAQKIIQAVPFDEFQRLRRDSGALAARAAERPDTAVEGGVLAKFQALLSGRADDAAMGNLLDGERMTPDFAAQYNAARELTKRNAELYKGGNNISQVLRKPVGQNYTLNGDEVANKFWHGGSGLVGDVKNLRQVLTQENQAPAMQALQKMIMTDAASKTTAAGDLASGLPRYVENRLPGLAEALTDDQFKALTGVASDVRNADAAGAVKGLLGSDTYAKLSRSMDGGLLDAPLAKTLSGLLSFKGIGAETIRSKGAEAVMSYKGKTLAELLANPKLAAKALENAAFVEKLSVSQVGRLQAVASRSVPQLAAD